MFRLHPINVWLAMCEAIIYFDFSVTPLNLKSPFNRKALDSLEEAGISLISTHHFALSYLVNACLGDAHPTWKNLLQIIRLLQQDDLAKQVETYLTEGKLEHHHEVRAQSKLHEVYL